MIHAQEMLRAHPRPTTNDAQALSNCIQCCVECAQTCIACADACLAEDGVKELAGCIRLNLDCADVCEATGRIVSRQTKPNPDLWHAQLYACIEACRICAKECERHAGAHEHCRVCAEACRRCEAACRRVAEDRGAARL